MEQNNIKTAQKVYKEHFHFACIISSPQPALQSAKMELWHPLLERVSLSEKSRVVWVTDFPRLSGHKAEMSSDGWKQRRRAGCTSINHSAGTTAIHCSLLHKRSHSWGHPWSFQRLQILPALVTENIIMDTSRLLDRGSHQLSLLRKPMASWAIMDHLQILLIRFLPISSSVCRHQLLESLHDSSTSYHCSLGSTLIASLGFCDCAVCMHMPA